MRAIDLIVIHCSATKNGQAVTTDTLRQWHKAKGWKDIGYHYVIEVTGRKGLGRLEASIGAGVEGHNANSIHVCMVGGIEVSQAFMRATPMEWATLKATIQDLQKRYPKAKVVGHRDLSPDIDHDGKIEPREWVKACPAFDVAAWIANGMEPTEPQILHTTQRGHA